MHTQLPKQVHLPTRVTPHQNVCNHMKTDISMRMRSLQPWQVMLAGQRSHGPSSSMHLDLDSYDLLVQH
jgi:hypothetical protein